MTVASECCEWTREEKEGCCVFSDGTDMERVEGNRGWHKGPEMLGNRPRTAVSLLGHQEEPGR